MGQKTECWAAVRAIDVNLSEEVHSRLTKVRHPNVGAYRDGNNMVTLSNEEIERQQRVMAMTADDIASLFKETSRYMNNHGMRHM